MIITPDNKFYDILHGFRTQSHDFRSLDYDLCNDTFEKIKNSIFFGYGFIEIFKPEFDRCLDGNNIYVVKQRLTNLGEAALLTLERKCCFNLKTKSFDPLATEDYYKEWIGKQEVPDYIFQFLDKTNEPFIKQVKNDLIAFKLSSASKIIDGQLWWVL